MSNDKPASTLDQLRTQLDHWWGREATWFNRANHATNRYHKARAERRRLEATIAAAEAAQEQRIVTEDDGSPE